MNRLTYYLWQYSAIGLTAVGLNNLLSGIEEVSDEHLYHISVSPLLSRFYYLSEEWLPMGPQKGMLANILPVAGWCSHHPKHPVAARYVL